MSDTSSDSEGLASKETLSDVVKPLEHLINVYLAKDDKPAVLSPREVIDLKEKALGTLKDLRKDLELRDLIFALRESR